MIWPFSKSDTPTFDLIFAGVIFGIVLMPIVGQQTRYPPEYGWIPILVIWAIIAALGFGRSRLRANREGEI